MRPNPILSFFRSTNFLVIVALAATVLASLLIAQAVDGQATASIRRDLLPVYPKRELPREWRWERDPVTFDDMFRTKHHEASPGRWERITGTDR
jgi:hypothetical protein